MNCVPRLILPGWAQTYLGERVVGQRFFWVWLALALAGVACYGSQFGAIVLGAMVAVHCGSIIDVFWRLDGVGARVRRQIATAAGCILVTAAYWLIGVNVHRVVDSRQWIEVGQPFAARDVVLFRPGAYADRAPQPGDVVVYSSQGRAQPTTILGWRAAVQINGDWVDRVIAGPGSHVVWESGQLWVDDQLSDLRPLNPERMPQRLELTVPEQSFAIFPTTHPYFSPAAETSVVNRGRILGLAIARNYPPWRIWVLR
ncbi:MAG TPA: hypothetical protein VHY91_14110 [Pirellulales bacterium]|jgi:hypothetical protein|nr:hypothetical protein [Pirellulales bacterium]